MIQSNKFAVNSDTERLAAVHYASEQFAQETGLNARDTLRLDLLVEETLGMVKAMLEDYYGQVWFTNGDGVTEIHVEVTSDMNADKKEELLSVSTTGKNAAAKGFMAKIGELISGAVHYTGRAIDIYGEETLKYGIVHTPAVLAGDGEMMTIWSLQGYRDDLEIARANDAEAEEAWDDLERSIVARLADDIVVGVRGDRVDLVIRKRF